MVSVKALWLLPSSSGHRQRFGGRVVSIAEDAAGRLIAGAGDGPRLLVVTTVAAISWVMDCLEQTW